MALLPTKGSVSAALCPVSGSSRYIADHFRCIPLRLSAASWSAQGNERCTSSLTRLTNNACHTSSQFRQSSWEEVQRTRQGDLISGSNTSCPGQECHFRERRRMCHVATQCHRGVTSPGSSPEANASASSEGATWQQEKTRTARGFDRDGGNRWTSEEDGEKAKRNIDVATLGNLCVDVVVNVDKLPPLDRDGKWNYMQQLMASPPDESFWEGGGNANTLIAAGRLGLKCTALGHVGDDVFGEFFVRILLEEGVQFHDVGQGGLKLGGDDYSGETLIVWVMLDPDKKHAFCSRFDFNTNPMFSRLLRLPSYTERLIRHSKALFINGFSFDEIPPSGVVAAAQLARDSGTAVFFDPGPRTGSLVQANRAALDQLLRLSSVIMLTEEEAVVLTGIEDPVSAARHLLLLENTGVKWVIVKKGAFGCVMATQDCIYSLPGFVVEVADTVGCGDSFAAAVMLGYTQGESPNTTLALANAVGAATATGMGAGRHVANAQTVEAILLSLQAENDEAYLVRADEGVVDRLSARASKPTRLEINGSPHCPSGVPLHVAIKGALDLLKRSLKQTATRV